MSLSEMLGSMILTLGPKSGAADAVTAWSDAAPATPGTRTPTSRTAAKARPRSGLPRPRPRGERTTTLASRSDAIWDPFLGRAEAVRDAVLISPQIGSGPLLPVTLIPDPAVQPLSPRTGRARANPRRAQRRRRWSWPGGFTALPPRLWALDRRARALGYAGLRAGTVALAMRQPER